MRGVPGQAPCRQRPFPLFASFIPFFPVALDDNFHIFLIFNLLSHSPLSAISCLFCPTPSLRKVVSIYPCLIAGYLLLF